MYMRRCVSFVSCLALVSFTILGSVSKKDGESKISADELAKQTALLLVAGQETTVCTAANRILALTFGVNLTQASTMAFLLWELARHPALQTQLRAEIHSTLAREAGSGARAYDSMPLLNACIKVGSSLSRFCFVPGLKNTDGV